jgi:hypothetical protein
VDAGYSVYSVIGDSFQAILLPSEPPPSDMVVRLADTSIAWLADGTCEGVSLFDLEPGGATACPLTLPNDYQLLQVLVDGAPAATRVFGDNTWRIPLSSKRLPQRVEVVFRGKTALPDPSGRKSLQSPTLGTVHIGQTLWTVAGPTLFTAGSPRNSASLTHWQQQLFRMKNVAAIIQSAFLASADTSDETSRWYPLWLRRFMSVRVSVQRGIVLAGSADATRTVQGECKTINDEQSLLAERLDAEEIYRQFSTATATGTDEPAELWAQNLGGHGAPTRCLTTTNTDSLVLDYRPINRSNDLLPLAVAVILAVAFVAVAILWSRGIASHWLQSWPYLCLAPLGIVWWLWLWPSVLGLVVLLGCLLATVRKIVLPSR